MNYKSAYFLGAVSAKLYFLREDLVDMATRYQLFPGVPAEFDNLIESVDRIQHLVERICEAENAEEAIDSNGENRTV